MESEWNSVFVTVNHENRLKHLKSLHKVEKRRLETINNQLTKAQHKVFCQLDTERMELAKRVSDSSCLSKSISDLNLIGAVSSASESNEFCLITQGGGKEKFRFSCPSKGFFGATPSEQISKKLHHSIHGKQRTSSLSALNSGGFADNPVAMSGNEKTQNCFQNDYAPFWLRIRSLGMVTDEELVSTILHNQISPQSPQLSSPIPFPDRNSQSGLKQSVHFACHRKTPANTAELLISSSDMVNRSVNVHEKSLSHLLDFSNTYQFKHKIDNEQRQDAKPKWMLALKKLREQRMASRMGRCTKPEELAALVHGCRFCKELSSCCPASKLKATNEITAPEEV